MTLSWELEDKDKLVTALEAAPTEFAKQSKNAAGRNVGTVNSKAREYFEGNILRPQERGLRAGGSGGHGRQTTNFTFGARGGGAFSGSVLTAKGGIIGFGYPNVPKADAATSGVWRVQEYGLKGTRHAPSSLFGDTSLASKGEHILPKRYQFGDDTDERGTGQGQIMLIGPQFPKRNREGAGYEGKHFIENAWIESLYIISDRYRDATDRTMRVAFGR